MANKKTDSKTEPVPEKTEPKFSKDQLLNSHWYSHKRDILSVLLTDGEQYAHADVEMLLKDFSERKVT